MLSHPNGWVRNTANRLLLENPDGLNGVQESLGALIADTQASVFGRVQALWLYRNLAQTHDAERAPTQLSAEELAAIPLTRPH